MSETDFPLRYHDYGKRMGLRRYGLLLDNVQTPETGVPQVLGGLYAITPWKQ